MAGKVGVSKPRAGAIRAALVAEDSLEDEDLLPAPVCAWRRKCVLGAQRTSATCSSPNSWSGRTDRPDTTPGCHEATGASRTTRSTSLSGIWFSFTKRRAPSGPARRACPDPDGLRMYVPLAWLPSSSARRPSRTRNSSPPGCSHLRTVAPGHTRRCSSLAQTVRRCTRAYDVELRSRQTGSTANHRCQQQLAPESRREHAWRTRFAMTSRTICAPSPPR
jgi:hypothetical protein